MSTELQAPRRTPGTRVTPEMPVIKEFDFLYALCAEFVERRTPRSQGPGKWQKRLSNYLRKSQGSGERPRIPSSIHHITTIWRLGAYLKSHPEARAVIAESSSIHNAAKKLGLLPPSEMSRDYPANKNRSQPRIRESEFSEDVLPQDEDTARLARAAVLLPPQGVPLTTHIDVYDQEVMDVISSALSDFTYAYIAEAAAETPSAEDRAVLSRSLSRRHIALLDAVKSTLTAFNA